MLLSGWRSGSVKPARSTLSSVDWPTYFSYLRPNVTWRWPGLGVDEMSGLLIQSTAPHDHTGRSLPCTQHELRIKLEIDACRPPLYSQNKRTKLAPNLNPFSRRVSRTHMVTSKTTCRNYVALILVKSFRVSLLLLIHETWALLLMRLYFALQVLIQIRIV